jgi:hypothetical protein
LNQLASDAQTKVLRVCSGMSSFSQHMLAEATLTNYFHLPSTYALVSNIQVDVAASNVIRDFKQVTAFEQYVNNLNNRSIANGVINSQLAQALSGLSGPPSTPSIITTNTVQTALVGKQPRASASRRREEVATYVGPRATGVGSASGRFAPKQSSNRCAPRPCQETTAGSDANTHACLRVLLPLS